MADTKFTPGKWIIAGGYYLAALGGPPENEFRQICTFDKDDDWEVEQAANKFLILAAPAMYGAMQEFCDRVEGGEVRSRKTYAKFKSILALARGETNQPQGEKESA